MLQDILGVVIHNKRSYPMPKKKGKPRKEAK